jgi:hypothetical protein
LELLEEFYDRDDTAHNKGYNFLDCCVRGYPPYILQQPVSFTGDYMEAHEFLLQGGTGYLGNTQWYKDDVAIPDEELSYTLPHCRHQPQMLGCISVGRGTNGVKLV